MEIYEAAERFIGWMERRVVTAARGDNFQELDVEPSGKFWLGRLASEEYVELNKLGERGERLAPCAIGIRLRPMGQGHLRFSVKVSFSVWLKEDDGRWRKHGPVNETISVSLPLDDETREKTFGRDILAQAATRATGEAGYMPEIRTEVVSLPGAPDELVVSLVNATPKEVAALSDVNLFECWIEIDGIETTPYALEALPDSFRYNRDIPAYGINCGIETRSPGVFRTTDVVSAEKSRPQYWSAPTDQPDFSFETLSTNPLIPARALLEALSAWGEASWSAESLDERQHVHEWTSEMRSQADGEANQFKHELDRLREGIELLETDATLERAFRLANRSIKYSSSGKYEGWRPFQLAFLLSNLSSIVDSKQEPETADIVWFATGGGKTETYLGLIVTAALYDRLTGKLSGVTAWSRFPLRMLSLQQTQRFADAIAGAELVRREENIPGDPFSVGFLVGQGATPNRVRPDPPASDPVDPDDPNMPARYQVLSKCPFCHQDSIQMGFNRRSWKLDHRCTNDTCAWGHNALPFYVVDEEIYRFLPTVIVGTLDKAASISMQAAMRGLVGAPAGKCSIQGHGYTYAPRSSRPKGCLVPGCRAESEALDQAPERFGPTFRLQDELHLLRDSLGAVDSHYEALYDDLQQSICGRKPKILASSATLTGYEKQVDVLYRRKARVFPLPGPSTDEGFWTSASNKLMRRYVSLAPRGVTLEYAVDRTLTELQLAIREFIDNPGPICDEIGIERRFVDQLILIYGTDVVYGNNLRDLDAVMRSLETQVRVGEDKTVKTASLTSKLPFDEVRKTLSRLEQPETDFEDRLHVITASSMMSHGVDIERLNKMVMLGLPLGTAEFIQATARVGRTWPGLVIVIPKMARERDAGVYRSFGKFVEQGDRFVEPIPITRRSKRVLERTVSGLELARILAIHEPEANGSLTTVAKLREFEAKGDITREHELSSLVRMLQLSEALDLPLKNELEAWIDDFFHNLRDPGGTFRYPSDLSPTGDPMLSLRDVEEQVPVYGEELG
ncbi:helicase [Thiohalobacter thiocyanaticus]|uniref:Helicase n=1 Tax=Thiohalobacter thiocyanaticus TaxID=585455 RepID=A0A1Z4VM47_9GAMM|nr:helicase-related protein [Thiohalobacter thiocyanaticus]BAZ92555.1 helicase [Thiohalobacter thiocyanaticus]